MKITASRRDDIIRERDQFEADFKSRQEAKDRETSNWQKATQETLTLVKELVQDELPETSLQIEIDARTSFGDTIEVTISNQRFSPHVEGNALSWNWTVRLDQQGNVVKESNSWSGLKATTLEELDSLEETVKVLRACNAIDWTTILSIALPKFDDYVQDRGPSPKRPDFEGQLREAEIEECVGQPVLVQGLASESSGFRVGTQIYYLIVKETPKQYVVHEAAQFQLDNWKSQGLTGLEILKEIKSRYSYRINKAKFFSLIESDYETLDLS